MNSNKTSSNDIVVTGLGMLTAHGLGIKANVEAFTAPSSHKSQDDYKVVGFNPVPHLTDRKVIKAVAHRDILGLVALEDCMKNSGISPQTINPERTGLYVGAPPSSCEDHHNYHEGMESSVDASGKLIEKNFGENFRSASPTTLLNSLPNNVLCYGSKTMDARGPNSNYTTLETSSHMAIIGASRAMRRNRIDSAIIGGYAEHGDKVFISSMKARGLYNATPMAEGAAFATIETRANAEKRGAKVICTILACNAASDAQGPYKMASEPILADLITQTLNQAQVKPEDIEVVMTTGSGVAAVDSAEQKAIAAIWSGATKPLVASTATRWGNLMEAGGVAEIGFLHTCYANKSVPESAMSEKNAASAQKLNIEHRKAAILRATPWGEYTCLIVEMAKP